MLNNWLATGFETLSAVMQPRTALTSRIKLWNRLRRSKEVRANFASSHVDKTIAFQLRAIRDLQGLSQKELAERVGMNQNAISRLESEWYGKPTIGTLKRLAAALDVALVVRFVPFSQLVDWASGAPFIDHGLSTSSLAVKNFSQEATQETEKEQRNEMSNAIEPTPQKLAFALPQKSYNEAGKQCQVGSAA